MELNGEWVEDRFEGWGTCKYPEGFVYTGDWIDNKMHGSGKLVSSNGDEY